MKWLPQLLFILSPLYAVADEIKTIRASSDSHQVALVELYTSEGCSSCPPADEWLSKYPGMGFTPDRVVPLAFHVTYWDYIGWKDPFADKQYDNRQREMAQNSRLNTVYTPHVFLNGMSFRNYNRIDEIIKQINAETAAAKLDVQVKINGQQLHTELKIITELDNAQLYIALYENNLSNRIDAGENKGKQLKHDYVVRELSEPITMKAGQQLFNKQIALDEQWRINNMGLVLFVQHKGQVVQAMQVEL